MLLNGMDVHVVDPGEGDVPSCGSLDNLSTAISEALQNPDGTIMFRDAESATVIPRHAILYVRVEEVPS